MGLLMSKPEAVEAETLEAHSTSSTKHCVEQEEKEEEFKAGMTPDGAIRGAYGIFAPSLSADLIRYPFSSVRSSIDPDVLAFVLESDIFTCEEADLTSKGFERCVDYPHIPKHIYYEGYFHALPSPDCIESLSPRWGTLFQKPAAPIRLRAFMLAFKKVNCGWIEELGAAYPALKDVMNEGKIFSDLAVQVHYGDEVGMDSLGWHSDAVNSLVHLGVSLKGRRSLCTRETMTLGIDPTLHTEPQVAPDVYLSSPFVVKHAVQYPECTWDDRIIAMQCRILFDFESVEKCRQSLWDTSDGGVNVMTRIADIIASSHYRMPNMNEVMEQYRRLA